MDHTPGRRGHGHRGRRGSDRRGPDRRTQPPPAQQQSRGEQVDVESIMRDIRARISKQHGVDLTDHQIQELAARRLEAILDVRSMNPSLLDQLRRSVGGRSVAVPHRSVEPLPELDEASLFEGGLRRLLRPLAKLYVNAKPLVDALNAQAGAIAEIARREAERDQQQAEWNALHYELLKRLVTEVSRGSLEAQGLGLRVESLAAKVDFNERRVRGLEGTMHEATVKATATSPAPRSPEDVAPVPPGGGDAAAAPESQRRRRRRRRGRRGNAPGEFVPGGGPAPATAMPGAPASVEEDEGGFEDEGGDDNGAVTTEGEFIALSATDDEPVDNTPGVASEYRATPDVVSAESTSTSSATDAPAAADSVPAPPDPRTDDPREG